LTRVEIVESVVVKGYAMIEADLSVESVPRLIFFGASLSGIILGFPGT
jgi:hypothetical protein